MGNSGGNGFVAFARVVGSVCEDIADVLAWRDLVQKTGQHGCISDVAAGDFNRPNFRCFLIDPHVHLAPYASFRATMLAGLPFTFTISFDPRAIDE